MSRVKNILGSIVYFRLICKGLIVFFVIFFSNSGRGQSVSGYVSTGVSIGNLQLENNSLNSFNKTAFPSIEGGVMGKRVSTGIAVGCENMFASPTSRFFYELKSTFSIPIEEFNLYGIFGAGSYFQKKFVNFIEYGAGFSYMPHKFGYFIQYSNWADSNYISLGVTHTVKLK